MGMKKPLFLGVNHVPEVGLEPTHLSILHFECSASANSATRARITGKLNLADCSHFCEQRDPFPARETTLHADRLIQRTGRADATKTSHQRVHTKMDMNPPNLFKEIP